MFVRVHPGKRKGVYGNSRAYGFSTPRLASQAAEITPPRAVPSAEGLFGFGGVVRHTVGMRRFWAQDSIQAQLRFG